MGFAFGYDVTMILRDLPEDRARKLFEPKEFGGKSPWVWWKEFDIDYLPKQYFRVRRVTIERGEDGKERRKPVKGSTRTIYETFGFFQKSFVKCIEQFEVGDAGDRRRIAEDKSRRSSFTEIGERERDYCHKECIYLAELMEKLRQYCNAAAIRPRTWNGAGKLAAALHKMHDTPGASDLKAVPPQVWDMANMAYYGGRFEVTRTGLILEEVHEYDIRSAYPDAMRFLPCLAHGTWHEATAKEIRAHHGLYVAACTFAHTCHGRGEAQLGGLPVRTQEGHLVWPLIGGGVYWSPEIESARLLGAKVTIKGGWIYRRECECQMFDWVEPLFDYRREIGSQGPGYPIKLGINSLYGKLAQRKGAGRYNNMIWAGLITAMTRAKINRAIAKAPNDIVMVATDAVYSLKPLDLACGELLGQWEHQALKGLFIVQPGLYWCPEKRKRKSRGLSGSFFEQPGMTERFESAWEDFLAMGGEVRFGKANSARNYIISKGGIRLRTPGGKVHPEAGDIIDRFKDYLTANQRKKAASIRDRQERLSFLTDCLYKCRKLKGLFGNGLSPDYMRESMAEEGWFIETSSQGEDISDFMDLLDDLDILHPDERYYEIADGFPSVSVPVPAFIGLKLALARNKPDLAGKWVSDERQISFDYRNTRQSHTVKGSHIVTTIKAGAPGLYSLPHRDFLAAGGHEPWENARLLMDEQPDYVDLGPPFED